MSQEIKPCPSCGGQAMERVANKGDSNYVYCLTCGLRTLGYADIKYAIKDWNTRNDDEDTLEKQLDEKDAMIDWLTERLANYSDKASISLTERKTYWRKAAQEAAKKNDR